MEQVIECSECELGSYVASDPDAVTGMCRSCICTHRFTILGRKNPNDLRSPLSERGEAMYLKNRDVRVWWDNSTVAQTIRNHKGEGFDHLVDMGYYKIVKKDDDNAEETQSQSAEGLSSNSEGDDEGDNDDDDEDDIAIGNEGVKETFVAELFSGAQRRKSNAHHEDDDEEESEENDNIEDEAPFATPMPAATLTVEKYKSTRAASRTPKANAENDDGDDEDDEPQQRQPAKKISHSSKQKPKSPCHLTEIKDTKLQDGLLNNEESFDFAPGHGVVVVTAERKRYTDQKAEGKGLQFFVFMQIICHRLLPVILDLYKHNYSNMLYYAGRKVVYMSLVLVEGVPVMGFLRTKCNNPRTSAIIINLQKNAVELLPGISKLFGNAKSPLAPIPKAKLVTYIAMLASFLEKYKYIEAMGSRLDDSGTPIKDEEPLFHPRGADSDLAEGPLTFGFSTPRHSRSGRRPKRTVATPIDTFNESTHSDIAEMEVALHPGDYTRPTETEATNTAMKVCRNASMKIIENVEIKNKKMKDEILGVINEKFEELKKVQPQTFVNSSIPLQMSTSMGTNDFMPIPGYKRSITHASSNEQLMLKLFLKEIELQHQEHKAQRECDRAHMEKKQRLEYEFGQVIRDMLK